MKKLNLKELYKKKNNLLKKRKMSSLEMYEVLEAIKIKKENISENTSATGGPSAGGTSAGAIVSAQPSGLAGQTIGPNWASNGGTTGSGDVSVPYNPSGSNRVFQQVPMGKNHGARTGKKSREKKIDLKALRQAFNKKEDDKEENKGKKKEKSVMNFNNFLKKEFTTIKK